ncbi:MAG: hypothetical protein A3H35_21495 [Betaproteobacteria bacterium RIFCSPLOWO2_02_FULL_62_17]|nr:MAG: hypothetical protein A3H35_21495 [Betaproteobacteria bacterium RIFCSPLOWO2_02_FULL_62_17]
MGDEPKKEAGNVDPQWEAMRAAAKRIDKVNEWLRLGGAIPQEECHRLREAGITHVVDLREEYQGAEEHLASMGINRRHVPVSNFDPPTTEQLREVARWIEDKGGMACTYVHCGGGIGRAATMAVALLTQSGIGLDAALRQVREARPEIRINDLQMEWLRTLEQSKDRTGG